MRVAGCNEVIEYRTLLLHRTLVANGTKRHSAQQMVALGGKADIAELALSVRRAPILTPIAFSQLRRLLNSSMCIVSLPPLYGNAEHRHADYALS